jgi:CubicO group peptidase (beta-lactamase class C family)
MLYDEGAEFMRRSLIPVAVVALAVTAVSAQREPLAGFDADVAKAVSDWRVPGLAIAVVKDGHVVFAHGYGVRELGKPDAVDTHTLFAIGSTTKAMTAALVGMLVDEKKVAWDAPVTTYLPWFQLKDPAVTRQLTVRDLLTHRAGLGNADYLWYGQSNSTDEILRRVRLIDPAYPVRASFIYQNLMYAAAGAVVEAASGMSWAAMIRTRIFDPLGMRDTIPTAASLSSRPNVASPHSLVDGQVRVIENVSVDPVAAAGAVWSSVDDMSKWMQLLLDGGRAGGASGRRLLSEETFKELFTPQAIAPYDMYPTTRLTKPHWMTYGLGWFQQDYRGRAVDFHTGSIDGMVAIHGLVRDEHLGVYVLGNLDHAEVRHALMYAAFDRYSDVARRDWSADFRKLYADLAREDDAARASKEALRVTGTAPSLPLARFAGEYAEPLHGDVKVSYDGHALRLQYGSAFVGALEHWHYNTFRARWSAAWRTPQMVTFALDEDGKPAAVELMGARFTRKPDQGKS